MKSGDILHSGHIPVRLRISPRARRMTIKVLPEGFELVVPPQTPERLIQDFLIKVHPWIMQRSVQIQDRAREYDPTQILIRGIEHTVRLNPDATKAVSYPEPGVVVVKASSLPDAQRILVHDLVNRSVAHIEKRVLKRAKEMGVTVTGITIRDQKTRWGSCSSKGRISLNWRLMLTPDEVLDYLIVHELAHRKEMNHSIRFWQIVETYCPTYQQHEAWLNKHGQRVMLSLKEQPPQIG